MQTIYSKQKVSLKLQQQHLLKKRPLNQSNMPSLCVTTTADLVDNLRKILAELQLNDPTRRLKFLKEEKLVAIPIKDVDSQTNKVFSPETLKGKIANHEKFNFKDSEVCIRTLNLPLAKRFAVKTPLQLLKSDLECLIVRHGYEWTGDVVKDIPSHWEIHGNLVLIPSTAFTLPIWTNIGAEVWLAVTKCLSCNRLAKKCPVSIDQYRTPQVTILHGDSGWVEQVDNGIRYTYDVTKCMFSAGNITEKLRVAGFKCNEEIVVDLYAGIGYFTLPYLVYTGVKHLHACEWNPDAVEALRRNLAINSVEDRCTVHMGDNKQVCPKGVADRVNLGLIPSSREGWPVACAALKPDTGGILHIHYNVNTKNETRDGQVSNEPQELFRCEAKSRSPSAPLTVDDKQVKDLHNMSAEDNTFNKNTIEPGGLKKKTDVKYESRNPSKTATEKQPLYETCDTPADDKCYLENASTCNFKGEQTAVNSKNSEPLTDKCDQKSDVINSKWYSWAEDIAPEIRDMLQSIHGSVWTTDILHIEHVKSYAPYVDHIVLDLKCKPVVQ